MNIQKICNSLSLRSRLRLIILVPSLMMFIVSVAVYIKDSRNDYLANVESQAQSLSLGMSSALELSLIVADKEGLDQLLNETIKKTNSIGLVVYDKEGNFITQQGVTHSDSEIRKKTAIFTEVFRDVFVNGGVDENEVRKSEIIGYLEVVTGDINYFKTRSSELVIALIIFTMVLLVTFILADNLGNKISFTIKDIINISEENYSSKQFTKPYYTTDKSELGLLVENKERERILVKEMLEEEQELRRQADAAYIARTKMLQVISHELNTPLSSAYGMVQLVNNRIGKYTYNKLNKEEITVDKILMELSQITHYSTVAERNIEHLGRFINDLLAISDEEIFGCKYNEIAIDDLVEDIYTKHGLDARSKSIKLTLTKEYYSKTISSDDLRISQILNNLLSNAIKYTEVGTVSLFVKTTKDNLQITITDTGCGIESDEYEKIFRLSGRSSTQTGNLKGQGIGLFVVKKCVDTLNGDVKVESDVGSYSKFDINLPLYQLDSKNIFNKNIELRKAGLKIYIIDDDKDNLFLFTEILKLFDVTVKDFTSPFDAYEEVKSNKPDIILVDYQLYGMSGFEFIHQVRKHFDSEGVMSPFIICSSASGTTLNKALQKINVDGFIPKPFNIHEIISVINSFYTGKNYLTNQKKRNGK